MKITTKADDREQWRARILRALSEFQTDLPGQDRGSNDGAQRGASAQTPAS